MYYYDDDYGGEAVPFSPADELRRAGDRLLSRHGLHIETAPDPRPLNKRGAVNGTAVLTAAELDELVGEVLTWH